MRDSGQRKLTSPKDMPEVNLGDTLTVDMFSEEDWVDVTGISKEIGRASCRERV